MGWVSTVFKLKKMNVCVYKSVEIDAIEGNKYIYIYMFSNMNSFELDPSEK